MTVRPARAADTLRVCELMREALSRSPYRDITSVDADSAKKLLLRSVHFHGHVNAGATFYLVSENETGIHGFFLGALSPVYHVGTTLEAQDVYLYVNENAPRRDAGIMIRQFWAWAMENENVVEIAMSNSDFIPDNRERVGNMLLACGFLETNNVYRRRIAR